MNTTFKLSDGQLTNYAFACGYQQIEQFSNGYVKMWKEHCTFHVVCKSKEGYSWDSFDNIGLARKCFHKKKMTLKKYDKIPLTKKELR